jgi:AraC family transcriptional regulator
MHNVSKLYIKGMVCQRCITTIHDQLTAIGLRPTSISLGEVTLSSPSTTATKPVIEQALQGHGFTLLEDRNEKIIREVKELVERVYSGDFDFPYQFRFSTLVASQLNKDYDAISSIFSSSEGITLEKYVIAYRIGKVKELLVYTTMTLEHIAFKLGFSSSPHLSRQFKSETGISPSTFRGIRENKRSLTKDVFFASEEII